MEDYHEGNPLIGKTYHNSVFLKEVMGALDPAYGGVNIRDAWYIDCTLGDGGHSIEIIKRGGRVIGIDVDPQALGRVQERFKELGYLGILGERIKLVQGNFRDVKKLIQQTDAGKEFAGAIFDLGVSSVQLETPGRGFSFSKEGPLDMRMDPTLQVRALDLINAGGRKELNELFSRLGEEKYSRRLADALVLAREIRGKDIRTTRDLADFVEKVVGGRKGRIHPATQVFQALRIAVNDELGALQEGLDQIIDLMEKKGRIVVISFHSLEDRIVKFTFRKWEEGGKGLIITERPIVPSDDEVRNNPRSRSAKMRVFQRL
ncbi:16S rRNA (cytosine(1402)-N(4))-methyltransferase RsmH [Candidatus Daviesbacteria bacterium]|nr:16S rRNA (cytosine(1402)-N(4))-methyltransferase RsmH [Candidatus Daviesbacteria bacterium]